jgi:hypothetical protein
MSAYIKNTESSQVSDLMLHLKLLEKQEQAKPKTHSYTHLCFDKGTKKHAEWTASSTNVAGKTGYLPAENLN